MNEKEKKQRTLAQNRAMHLYFTQLAEELNFAGLDMKKVLKPEIDICWTPYSIKEYLWRTVQKSMLGKDSTKELTAKEINNVYMVLNRFISEKHGVNVEFPSTEEAMLSNITPEMYG
jgi:hypothetical protein